MAITQMLVVELAPELERQGGLAVGPTGEVHGEAERVVDGHVNLEDYY